MVETMEESTVSEVTQSFTPAGAVIGIGGGSALDHAKYVAWKTGLPLVLIPSILSVDAAFTKAIGIRKDSRVRYVGEVFPEHFLIDYGLLQSADPVLNIAGIGDILSIFTALWDWREAGQRTGENYHPSVAREAGILLNRLFEGADEIAKVSDDGLHLLSELYVGEVRLCEMVGSSRPEEGSEHYIAYALEHHTRRHYLHGALVGMGVLLAGAYQGQDVAPVREFIKRLGLDCSFEGVGTTKAEVRATLTGIGSYVKGEPHLLPGVFHFRDGILGDEIDALLAPDSPAIISNRS